MMAAACYALRAGASAAATLPAICHKPAANRPATVGAGAAAGALMCSTHPVTRLAMETHRIEHEPNAELHGFEPLRIGLALGALLLGLLVGFF